MSEGFHPKPRMSFPSALGLGIAGRNEVMELELADDYSDAELLDRLSNATVPGLRFLRVEHVPQGVKKAQLRSSTYEMEIPPTRVRQAETQASELIAAESFPVERPRGGKTVDPVDAVSNIWRSTREHCACVWRFFPRAAAAPRQRRLDGARIAGPRAEWLLSDSNRGGIAVMNRSTNSCSPTLPGKKANK